MPNSSESCSISTREGELVAEGKPVKAAEGLLVDAIAQGAYGRAAAGR